MSKTLRLEVEEAINRASRENVSKTPDYILAAYLMRCLDSFEAATNARAQWHANYTKQEVGLTVEELVERAHANAVEKGFWESGNVGEKFALIATEVDEFEGTVDQTDKLEELADIVIRTFDLCGHLGISLPPHVLSGEHDGCVSPDSFALFVYQRTARATQAHRMGKLDLVRVWLLQVVSACARFSSWYYGRDSLEQAILDKMEKNAGREHKHGLPY